MVLALFYCITVIYNTSLFILPACPQGTYGQHCNKTCSQHCSNKTTCDFITGHCGSLGCDPGYTADDCKTGKSRTTKL